MSIITNSKTLKVIALVAVVGVLFLGGAKYAKAITQAEATAICTALNLSSSQCAVIQALVTTSAPSSCASYMHSSTLRVGSNGSAVSMLQAALNAYNNAGLSTDGAFGNMTAAAAKAYQAKKGLSADGVVGAMTGAQLAADYANCSTTVTPTPPPAGPTPPPSPTGLTGGAGSVDTYEILSSLNNEDVGEGEEDSKVQGFEVDVDAGSDLAFTSMKVAFENSDAGSSEDLDDYASEVSIWLGSTEVGRASTDAFASNDGDGDGRDEWTKTIALSNAVVKADTKGKFYVAVTALENIDTADSATDSWDVDVDPIRFTDATGAIISENPGIAAVEFNFADFATAADAEMKVALAGDNLDSYVKEVDTVNDTDGVQLLKFTIEAKNTDIHINDLPVFLTVTGAGWPASISNTLRLKVGSDEFTETISTAVSTITFDNIDVDLDKGSKTTFTVLADVNDIEAGVFDEGDSLLAELRLSEVDGIDAKDEANVAISNANATGTALGDAVAFYSTGIMVSNFSTSAPAVTPGDNAGDDVGSFTITYKVTAFGGTVVVSNTGVATIDATIANATVATDSVLYAVEEGGVATVVGLSDDVDFSSTGGGTEVTNGIELADGEYTTFTLTVSRTNALASDSGIYRAFLRAISWATTDAAIQNVYDFDLEDYKTAAVSLN